MSTRMKLMNWLCLAAVGAPCLSVNVAATTPGQLDTTFNGTGVVTTRVGSSTNFCRSVVVQADGKILVMGNIVVAGNNDFGLVRYNTNGSLDAGFGVAGVVTTAIGSGDDFAQRAVIQTDGKIVAVGQSTNGSNSDFAVVRYNVNGSLDTAFGTGGKVTTAVGPSNDQPARPAVLSNGKIVVGGYIFNGNNDDFALVRYQADGSLDATFGTSGKTTTAIGAGSDRASGMVVLNDGKIVLAGQASNGVNDDFALVRYNADGSLDASFGSSGKVTTVIGSGSDQAFGLAVQTDGKLVAAGLSFNGVNNDFAVVRYNADGSLDTTFNGTGKRTTAVSAGASQGNDIAIQADGKILVVGYASNGSNDDMALVRYNTDGSLDTGFGTGGVVITAIGTGRDQAYGVALQKNGGIVVAGRALTASGTDFAVARYWAFPPQESWRLQHFGINTNTGNAADTFDFDLDGLSNLAEYAFGLVPTSGASCQPPSGQRIGNNFLFSFPTPVGVSGITYGAEWSTTLLPASWTPITDTGIPPQHVFSVPVGSNTRMFTRLKVAAP